MKNKHKGNQGYTLLELNMRKDMQAVAAPCYGLGVHLKTLTLEKKLNYI